MHMPCNLIEPVGLPLCDIAIGKIIVKYLSGIDDDKVT